MGVETQQYPRFYRRTGKQTSCLSDCSIMKLLILAKDYPPTIGGVENYSYFVAEGLGKHYTVQVLTFLGKQKNKSFADSVPVKRIKPLVNNELIKSVQYFFSIFILLFLFKPDMVLSTTWKVATPFLILQKNHFQFQKIQSL